MFTQIAAIAIFSGSFLIGSFSRAPAAFEGVPCIFACWTLVDYPSKFPGVANPCVKLAYYTDEDSRVYGWCRCAGTTCTPETQCFIKKSLTVSVGGPNCPDMRVKSSANNDCGDNCGAPSNSVTVSGFVSGCPSNWTSPQLRIKAGCCPTGIAPNDEDDWYRMVLGCTDCKDGVLCDH
jgi:hypothetical protein